MLLVGLTARGAAPQAISPPPPVGGAGHVDYVLQPGDKISVQVLDQPTLNDSMKAKIISQDYTVDLPYLEKPIDLTGATVRQAERLITERYKPDYLKNPTITVAVVEYVSRTVNVTGAVTSQRVVPIDPNKGLKLMDAITQAGGFNSVAKRSNVQVTRTHADGSKELIIIDATTLIKDPKNDLQLQPGDIIFVKEIII